MDQWVLWCLYIVCNLSSLLLPICYAETYKLKVVPGKTYLLRLINAALNDDLFFSIANHTVTVVEADALYVKPFWNRYLLIAPGQTTKVLLKTKLDPSSTTFIMAARPYFTGQGTFDNTTVLGILEYKIPLHHGTSNNNISISSLQIPVLPPINGTAFVANFSNRFCSLANAQYLANVPQTIDRKFFYTVGLGSNPCPKNRTCQGPKGSKFAASINISFVNPTTALLQSYFFGQN